MSDKCVMRINLWVQKKYFEIHPFKKLQITDLLSEFEGLEYVVLKVDTPYMPSDFPENYPIGKDLDILVARRDLNRARTIISRFVKSTNWPWKYKKINDDYREKIRFLWHGKLHYLIDITSSLNNRSLEKALLEERKKKCNKYYIPSIRSELLLRTVEYERCKAKKYHIAYILENKLMWDSELAKKTGIDFPESEAHQ